eukprot:scaffold5705_cov444-Prasinococcus_capsulatus_cf.AAC.1
MLPVLGRHAHALAHLYPVLVARPASAPRALHADEDIWAVCIAHRPAVKEELRRLQVAVVHAGDSGRPRQGRR